MAAEAGLRVRGCATIADDRGDLLSVLDRWGHRFINGIGRYVLAVVVKE
jgi:hypothetical protein